MGNCGGKPPPTPVVVPPPKRKKQKRGQAEIIVDDGEDEVNVDYIDDSYPDPFPPGKDNDVRYKNEWFDDVEFQKASDDADLFDTEIAEDDLSIAQELLHGGDVAGRKVKAVSPSGVNPKEKRQPKLKFDDVDAHARKADASLLNSFESLVTYLSEPWQQDRYKNIKIARAIVVWMSHQNLEQDQGKANADCPAGLLQYLKLKKMTYPTCYAILCRKAGLPCTIISGLVKAAGYEPGDTKAVDGKWNAVYCETGWQIVHPFWICKALYGHNLGGWVKVEKDGEPVKEQQKATPGVSRKTFQDHFFMPNPEHFLYKCYAQNKNWQLVESKCQVPNKHTFFEMPYLLPPFHGLGLELVREQKCVIESENGVCKIEFKGRSTNAHLLLLQYDLFLKKEKDNADDEDDNDDDDDDHPDMKDKYPRMVFNYRSNEHFFFEIRFPIEGTFKLVLYGGPFRSPLLRICEFKLVCKKRMSPEMKLLPLSCEKFGYGPGPVTMSSGLLMPTKPNGLIPVEPKTRTCEIKFNIRDDYIGKHSYSAAVHGEVDGRRRPVCETSRVCSKASEDKTDNITISVTKISQLVVVVTLPDDGEYGVTIHEDVATGNGEHRKKTICNYLVSTLAYRKQGMKANVRNAKTKLRETCASEVNSGEELKPKISSLEDNLSNCRKQGLPDWDEDICSGENMREFLKCKDVLRDCHLRLNYHVTLRALAIMERYKNRVVLKREIKKVQELREEQKKERINRSLQL